jgi:SSS family solute:Na+ symporter
MGLPLWRFDFPHVSISREILVKLGWIDLSVIVVYLAGITAFGARFRSRQHSLKDYFLGGRTIPWWAIALSIVSAETSVLTIIGTPALAYAGNLGFLQVVFGYLLARVMISTVLLPHYFRGELYTAYQLIERRFGQRLRRLTAAAFLVIRSLAEGVRVFAISILVGIVLGTGELSSVVIITILTLFYTFEGGMTAVIWTDVIQMCIYVSGAVISFFLLLHRVPGGWGEVTALAGVNREAHFAWMWSAAAGGKFRVLDFSLDLTQAYTFWAGLLGGMFLTTASHGTDQLMVQRLLSARNERDSRKALYGSWVVVLAQFTLFLVIGVMLFAYYRHFPPATPFSRNDAIFPTFIVTQFPPVAAGLVVAAILAAAMSNLSAALNSLASTSIMDFYRSFFAGRSEAHYLRTARLATLVWGVVLIAIALASARFQKSVFEMGLSIASVAYGALLGVFLLGVLTKRATQNGATIGMAAGLGVMIYVSLRTSIAFTWYVLIGTAVTFAVGMGTSYLLGGALSEPPAVAGGSGSRPIRYRGRF